MIIGAVDANLEARVPLFIEDITGQTHPLEAVVDSGYTGFLTLPPAQITLLGLQWLSQEKVMLADGSILMRDVYHASIIWDSQSRTVRVTAIDGSPLVGMKLLEGNEVRMKVIPGGLVHIDTIP
jgi:clan AA aspartic protease